MTTLRRIVLAVGHVALRHPQSMKMGSRSDYDQFCLRRTKADHPWSGKPA